MGVFYRNQSRLPIIPASVFLRQIEFQENKNCTNVTTGAKLRLFSWDEAKNESNQRKHGVSFEVAKLVFDDPSHITRQDRIENGEQRWQTVGMVGGVAVLLVAHTWHEAESGTAHIRIISARCATRLERKVYEQGT